MASEGAPIQIGSHRPPRQRWVAREEILKILRSQPPDPSFFEDLATVGGTLEDLKDPWPS